MFTPSRLTLARKRRGLTKGELAEKIGVTLRMVSFYEAGTKTPSEETLEAIAKALEFPADFFRGDDLEEMSLDSASFRALTSMTAGERDAAYASGTLAMLLSKWLEERFFVPKPDVPSLRGFGPEAAAQALRVEWRLGERPIRNMIHLVESHGARVFALPTDSRRIDAFSNWQRETPQIFVNTGKSGERVRFDLAHELAHLSLHQHGKPSGREAEVQADRFAGALLMPKASVLAYGPRNPSLSVLISHKHRWGVSASALAHRLHEVGLSTDWNYRTLCIELAKGGLANEPEPMPREGSQVLSKALAQLRDEKINHVTIARELALNADDVAALMFGLVMIPVNGGSNAVSGRPTGHLRLLA